MCWFYLKMNLVLILLRERWKQKLLSGLKLFALSLHLREIQPSSSKEACGQTVLFGQMEHFHPGGQRTCPRSHQLNGKTQAPWVPTSYSILPAQAACHMIWQLFKHDSGCLGGRWVPTETAQPSWKQLGIFGVATAMATLMLEGMSGLGLVFFLF